MSTATKSPPKRAEKAEKLNPIEAAKAKLPDGLRDKLPEIEEKVRALNDTAIELRYDIGEQLNELEADQAKYGTDPVKALTKVMPLSADSFRIMMAFAAKFTRPEVKRLKALRNPATDERLTWTHVAALVRVPNKDRAFELAEKAANQGFSSKALVKEVIRTVGKRSKGGRKPKGVKTFPDGVHVVADKTQALNNVYTMLLGKDGLSDLFADATANGKKLTQAEIDGCRAAVEQIDIIMIKGRQIANQLSTCIAMAAAAQALNKKLAS